MSFCRNCGTKLADDTKFCPNCGTPVKFEQPEYQEPVQKEPVQPEYQEPVQKEPVQPEYQEPVQPHYQAPNQPNYQAPNQPNYQAPNQPYYQAPNQPYYQAPNQPYYQAPNQPYYQAPNQPYYQAPNQPAPAKRSKEGAFKKIFSLISKISVASLSLIMLFVVLFAPIYSSPVDSGLIKTFGITTRDELKVSFSGIKLIEYGFLAMDDYTLEEYNDDYEVIMEEIEDEFDVQDIEDLTDEEIMKFINMIEIHRAMLTDYEDLDNETLTNNTFLELQLILGMIVVFAVIVLLVLAIIFSILSIFKQYYSYNKSVKFWTLSMALLFLFAGALRLSGFSESTIGLGASVVGGGLIACFIMSVIIFALIYLHELFNGSIKFNLLRVIGKGIAVLIVIISLFMFNGVFMTAEADGKRNITLNPSVQTQVGTIELNDDFYSEYYEEDRFPSANSVLNRFYSASKEYKYGYENYINTLFISEEVAAATGGDVIFVISYFAYMAAAVLLCLAFASLVQGLITDSTSIQHNINLITSMALTFFIVTLYIVVVAATNEVIDFVDEKSIEFAISAGPIVMITLLLGAVISSSIIIKKSKGNNTPAGPQVYQAPMNY